MLPILFHLLRLDGLRFFGNPWRPQYAAISSRHIFQQPMNTQSSIHRVRVIGKKKLDLSLPLGYNNPRGGNRGKVRLISGAS